MSVTNKKIENFGVIKSNFNDILVESVLDKNFKDKNLFKKYISLLKENKVLKAQFLVYSNLENKVESDVNKATEYVKENINLLKKFSEKEISEANKILVDLLGNKIEETPSELYENIDKLVVTNKTPDNIDELILATEKIVEHILNNKPKVISESINLPNSMLTSIMVDKYNEKYSKLDESEKSILKVLIDSNDDEKMTIYKKTLRECIDLIDANMVNSDLETKEKMLMVKDKLLNDKISLDENFQKNISKLIELKSNLK